MLTQMTFNENGYFLKQKKKTFSRMKGNIYILANVFKCTRLHSIRHLLL